MKNLVAALIAVSLAVLPASAKKNDTVPTFDVEKSCQGARSFVASDQDLAYRACLKDEKDAHAELVRKWSQFKPQDRRDCVAQGAAPMPSYVEILTCLEMSAEASDLYKSNGAARTKPEATSQGLQVPNLPALATPESTLGVSPPASDAPSQTPSLPSSGNNPTAPDSAR